MQDHIWTDNSEGGITCIVCGYARKLGPGGSRPRMNCLVQRGACLHLGAETRRVGCETCRGSVQVKVFGCTLYRECTLAKAIDGVACCATCEQFKAG